VQVSECVSCTTLPCADVNHSCYLIPDINITPERVRLVMIAEAAPADATDYFYADADAPLFLQTTLQAFQDAGTQITSLQELLDLGIYLTTAIKCGKTEYSIKTATIKECSHLLERELALFPQTRVIMLMGDVAKRALNYIAKRCGEPRVIPPGSTYKIRTQQFFYRTQRVFPSYLQAGPSFFIEKSKRRMIAEDIRTAVNLIMN
jgi:uracil-DNA glycosylase